jgi:hypothetical protein
MQQPSRLDESPESLTNVIVLRGRAIGEDHGDYTAHQKIIPFRINNNSGILMKQKTGEESLEHENHLFISR